MPEITLTAETGRPVGSRPSGRLRTDGKIPGVIYGHGAEPLSVAVEGRALRSALTGDAGLNALLELQVNGTTHLAMAKEIQRHPVRGTVTHVDFLIVRRDEVVTADVPVTLVGEAKEVNNADGTVAQELFSLTVHTTPANIPQGLEVDISAMTIGDAIRVSDITLPAGVTTDVDPESPVAVAQGAMAEEIVEVAEGEALTDAEAAEAAAEGEAQGSAEGGSGSGTDSSSE